MEIKDLAGLSAPATKLLEIMSNGVWHISEPYQKKRLAKADRAIKKDELQLEFENERQKRAFQLELKQLEIKQNNLEKITLEASKDIKPEADLYAIDPDFLLEFSEGAKKISNDFMQSLYAKIIAGEVNEPNSFSINTLKILSNMQKNDVELFENLCKTVFIISDAQPIIFDNDATIYNNLNLNFSTLSHLDDLGLIRFNPTTGFTKIPRDPIEKEKENIKYLASYFSSNFIIENKRDRSKHLFSLPIGQALFTKAGQELFKLAKNSISNDVLDFSIDFWKKEGMEITKIQ